MAWLDDHPPVRSQFRDPRRKRPTGLIVVHTAESIMDTVGMDTGAENVANFIRTRDTPGSYHDLVDSDSSINLVRYECEAYQDGTGSNPYALSVSFACSYLDWAKMSPERRTAFITRGAEAAVRQAKWVYQQTGILVPARRVARVSSSMGMPGFISHEERDPDRRKDPGNASGQFPWGLFLTMFKAAMYPPSTPTPQEEPMAFTLVSPESKQWWLIEPGTMTLIPPTDRDNHKQLPHLGTVSEAYFDRIDAGHKRIEA